MMEVRGPQRADQQDVAGKGQEVAGRRSPRRWISLAAAAVCAAAAGFLVAIPFWPQEDATPSGLGGVDSGVSAVDREWFDAPAYSPEATSEDLMQETTRAAEELLEAYPDVPNALSVVARVQYTLGQTDEARGFWERCTEIDPEYPDAYYGMGLVALDAGDYEKAGELFGRVTELAPSEPRAWSLRGQALMRMGRIAEGVALLEKHAQTGESTPDALVHLGQGYLQLRQFEEAKQTFLAALERLPKEARVYYGLATAYARLGEKEKARRCMEDFKKLESPELDRYVQTVRAYTGPATVRDRLWSALLESGQVYRRQGELVKAEEMWQKAAAVHSGDTRCRLELLALYEESGRERDALDVCEALCGIDPGNSDYWHNVGMLNGRLGRYDEALEAIEQAIRLDPENPRYRQARELIQRGN